MARVVVFVGSKSDVPAIRPTLDALDRFGVTYSPHIVSAHRAPERLRELVDDAESADTGLYICAAGLSAALPGAVAALTRRPVVGLPLAAGALNGVDALLSIAQMPPGVPVATVGINAAANAAYLAIQILATSNPDLARRYDAWRGEQASRVDSFE